MIIVSIVICVIFCKFYFRTDIFQKFLFHLIGGAGKVDSLNEKALVCYYLASKFHAFRTGALSSAVSSLKPTLTQQKTAGSSSAVPQCAQCTVRACEVK